jgi:hypothetical protein
MKSNENIKYIPPYWWFKNKEETEEYINRKYEEDRNEYITSGKWPVAHFYQKDELWCYYYYLKLTDLSIDLDHYFDFPYDTNTWTREKIINLMNSYGVFILYQLASYLSRNSELSFDEWYKRENDYVKKLFINKSQ